MVNHRLSPYFSHVSSSDSEFAFITFTPIKKVKKVQNNLQKYFFKKWLIIPLISLITFFITEFFAKHPQFAENYYSQKTYPTIAKWISNISNVFPFSLDDLLYVLLITTFILFIFLLLFKKISIQKSGITLLNILCSMYILFYFFWGFNYYRENINTRLNLIEQKPDTEKLIQQLEELINNTNNSYCTFEKTDKKQIDLQIEESYKNIAPALKLKYPSGKRKDKKITFSGFFAKAGISGYYGPFFNEIHVNTKVLPIEYPFVLAHEKAHQFGITSEAEANFYAWLVCTKSQSQQLQYSANLHILRFFIYQSYQLEEYPEIIAKLHENVKKDLIRIRENWMNLRNEKVDKVASKVNDTYLKTNKIEKGIEDYKGVVKFVMDFSQDSVFQKKIPVNSPYFIRL
jgi:hypothetical protein